MKTTVKKIILTLTFAATSLFATSTAMAQVDLEAVKKAITTSWSQTMATLPEITEVRATSISGLYEVVVGGDVLYSDRTGRYIVMGEMLDLDGKRNLTEERLQSLIVAINFDKLPFENSITVKRGNGERKLVIFEDPNCSYCHKFEQQLMNVDNITLHVFLYPILSADSKDVARNIWCSSNRSKAWEDWMVRQIAPATATCGTAANVLESNLKIGQSYGIKGTPTLIFKDGSRIPGAVGPQVVESKFKELY